MLKTFITASLLAAALFGASVVPASATVNSADCAYAAANQANGFGETKGGHYNADAVLLQQCR